MSAAAGALRVIDDGFLAQVREGADEAMRTLEVPHGRPYLDIEVLYDPHVDAPEGGDDPLADPERLVASFRRRYDQLREPLRDRDADIVLTGGSPVVQPSFGSGEKADPAASQAAVWGPVLGELAGHDTTALGAHAGAVAGEEMAAVFCLREEGGSAPEPLAFVVLLTWSGEVAAGARASRTEALIKTMGESAASHTPLHLICAVPDRDLSDNLIRECARLRVLLLLAGASGRTDIAAVSRARLQPGEAPSEVTVVRCPTFMAGVETAGMARVRVNAWRGDAEIALLLDPGSDRRRQPVQVLSQLLSASRVPSSERRLHSQVRLLLERAREEAEDEEQEEAVATFREEVDERWEEHGYATLGNDAGRVPMTENRHTSYNLLLLLRERNGGYDVLLSNHWPLRPSPLSDWSTLLLPAFKDARALLEHLRDDVMRQVQERAENFERAAHAHAFERAVEQILADDAGHGDELWADQLREVATRKIRKISPTTGAVTGFDYRLVTLLPLIDQATAKRADEEDQSEEGKRRLARYRIIEWLSGLDTVVAPDEDGGPRSLSVDAIEASGCGLRWDPAGALGGEAGTSQVSRAEQIAPGAIWFPLKEVEGKPLWRHCPSIVSRNADVMTWMESVLAKERREDGRLPTELLLGKHFSGPDAYRVEEVFPFEGGEDDPGEPAASTLAAMRRVEFAKDSDLAGQLAYEGMEIKRVFLVRHKPETKSGDREGIFVYAAEAEEEFDPGAPGREPLGMLRPVQRYVLKAGLERAEQIHQQVRPALAEAGDPWGFARLRKGGAPKPVAVTPPIIEQLHPLERECGGETDFIICDGNHRVVQAVWNGGQTLPAVAVIGDLPQPYYARPFGRLEWDATAENEQVVTPDVASKYLPRKVDREKDLPDDEARKKLAAVPDPMLFRRYYRDFESGFGYMGGQGGRFISG